MRLPILQIKLPVALSQTPDPAAANPEHGPPFGKTFPPPTRISPTQHLTSPILQFNPPSTRAEEKPARPSIARPTLTVFISNLHHPRRNLILQLPIPPKTSTAHSGAHAVHSATMGYIEDHKAESDIRALDQKVSLLMIKSKEQAGKNEAFEKKIHALEARNADLETRLKAAYATSPYLFSPYITPSPSLVLSPQNHTI